MNSTQTSSPLTKNDTRAFIERGFTRRQVGRIASVFSAGAALPLFNEFAMAQQQATRSRFFIPPDAVRIGANENPLGPSAEGLEAASKVLAHCGRYSPFNEEGQFIEILASNEGVKPDYVTPYAGSSDPLHRAVCAFTSPSRSFVMANPGYEAGAGTAKFIGAPVHRIPLRPDHSHDIEAMVKADPNAGIIYICNPNNPTGTLTSRKDIEWVLANKPKGSILLLDEAYLHFSEAPAGSDLVAADKDVIILRTFSKAYGMAGMRCGAAIGRPDLLSKMRPYGAGMMPVAALACANASLKSKSLVADRRRINREVREDVFGFLEKKNYKFIPSQSNCFMLDAGRPGADLQKAMMAQKVFIGRTWPIWPNMPRVTIGTRDEMEKFKDALVKVMG